MFGDGGGSVGANVVLTSDNSGYDQSMQQSASMTDRLAASYGSLMDRIGRARDTAQRVSFGVAAADIASVGAMSAAYGHFQEQMRGLQAQSNVLNRTYGDGSQRMKEYTRSVNELRSTFGSTTASAAQLVQTISGFERMGSTQGLSNLADTFEKMSESTGENSAQLAQSVLSLGQTMGTTLGQAKSYSDQLVTMAAASNTSATSLANFAAQIGPLGRQLNMTQSQVTGFAAAFSKAGQDGYRASNVFSQVTSDIAQSLQTNSPRLQQYANLLGVTTQALKSMSGAKVTAGLFDAIGNRGTSSLQTLNSLGYDGLNVTRTLSAVTQQSGGVQNMVRMAEGARGNGAADSGKQTFGQQFGKLRGDLAQNAELVGKPFVEGVLQPVMTFVDKLAKQTTEFMSGPGGKMIVALATIIGSFASLATAVLGATHVLGPLITILTIKNLAVTQGFLGGLRGGGGVGSGSEIGTGAKIASSPSYLSGARRAPAGFYNMGQPIGAGFRRVLGGAEEAAPAGLGLFGRTMGRAERAARGIGGFAWRTLGRPTYESATISNPQARTPFFQGGMFGRVRGGVSGGIGSLRGAGGVGAGPAEAALAQETNGLRARFQQLSMAFGVGVEDYKAQSIAAKLFVESEGNAVKAVDLATAKYGEQGALMEKIAIQFDALSKATGDATVAATALARAEAEAAAASLTGASARTAGMGAGAAGAGAALGGEAVAGSGAMAALGGPVGIGLLAVMLGPMLYHGLKGGDAQKPPNPIQGTGLPFAPTGVVAPIGQNRMVNFDPEHPSAVALYASRQGDYQTNFFSHRPSPKQAAAMYGPEWAAMTPQQKQMIVGDASKAFHGNVGQFLADMKNAQPGQWGAGAADAVHGMQGGLGALYANQANQNFANLAAPAGANLQSFAKDFFGSRAHQRSRYSAMSKMAFVIPLGRNGGSSIQDSGGTGFTGWNNSSSGDDLVKRHHVGGFVGIGGHNTNSLTAIGKDMAKALGQDAGDGSSFANALAKMPDKVKSDPGASMKYLLEHLSTDDLGKALGTAGETNITGDHGKDLATALKDFNAHSAKELTSALHGFNLNETQKRSIIAQENSNPAYGASVLMAHGATPGQVARLGLTGTAANTVAAYQAMQQQRMGMLSPYLSDAQQLFGSTDGRARDSGKNAGMIQTQFGSISGQSSLLGVAQTQFGVLRAEQGKGTLTGDKAGLEAYQASVGNVVSQYNSQVAAMKQYESSLESMNFSAKQFGQSMKWAAAQEKLSISREKSDQSRNVGREEYNFHLQRKRAETDYQRQRKWGEQEYNLSRKRAMEDFNHQTGQMIKQAALSMHDIYAQDSAQGTTSASFLLYNNAQQTASMNQQTSQLAQLRSMGMSDSSIQQLSLGSTDKAQELSTLFAQIQQNPGLIDQLNSAVAQRLSAAGNLATDSSSMSWQEQQHQFKLSLDRSATDFATSMKHSKTEFDMQMVRSAKDFTRQMHQQNSDFHRQLGRQQADYNTSVSHSWTTFNQGVSQSMKQMNIAAGTLSDTMSGVGPLVRAFGKDSNIGKNATALQNASPMINKLIGGLNNLLNPHLATSGKNEPLFMKLLDMLTGKGGLGGGMANPSAGGGLPLSIQKRMAADHPTAGYCLRDVANVLAAPHGAPTAYKAWLNAKGHRHHMGLTVPIGAPIFWGPERGGGAGHVAINAGGGQMWSEDTGSWQKKGIWGGALGWSGTLNGKQVSSEFGLKGFANGSWDLPKDMIAQIHAGEMIIPAKVAHAVRGVLSKGTVANLATCSQPVYNHVDARSYSTTSSTTFTGDIINQGIQDPAEFSAAMKQQARTRALAKR